ncbi:MAG: aminomethyltransferase beta-barrel domain-containing protein, partial [Gammaproteobacteria bacterium]
FLARYLAPRPGEIRTVAGKTVGEHPGVFYFTLGQRAGLGIGGVAGAAESPWYVVAKDLDNDVLIVAQGHAHPLLMSRVLTAIELSWVAGTAPALPCACSAKTRYRQPDQACAIVALEAGRAQVVFEEPQRAVTPGQAVVFYQGQECLGGGTIASTEHLAVHRTGRTGRGTIAGTRALAMTERKISPASKDAHLITRTRPP